MEAVKKLNSFADESVIALEVNERLCRTNPNQAAN